MEKPDLSAYDAVGRVCVEVRARLWRRRRVCSVVLGDGPQLVQLRRQHADQSPTLRQVLVDGRRRRRQQDRLGTQATGRRPR